MASRTTTFKIEGLQELGAKLNALGLDMTDKIARSATGAAAGVVVKAAKTKVPVRSGNLQRNIIAKRLPKSQSQVTSEHIVTVRRKRTKAQLKGGSESAYYGQFVEFGSVHNTPQPFLRPAFDENIQRAIETMKSVISTRIASGK